MKKIIVAMLILSVCILAACDNSSQPVVSGTGTGTETETPPVTPPADTSVVGNTVPDGAFFARWNGTEYEGVLSGGDQFPATFQEKDIFLYRDYAYRYGRDYEDNIVADGWGVTVAYDGAYDGDVDAASFPGFAFKDKSTYDNAGLICESINGKKIKSLNNLFFYCVALKTFADGFAVPAGVTNLYDMFRRCSSLETLPAGFTVPDSVTEMYRMFYNCTSLVSLPADFTIPDGVTDLNKMFEGCSSLETLPAGFTVPDSVTRMFDMFWGCTSLVSLPADFTIPDGVTNMVYMFYECSSLETLPADFRIPAGVTDVGCTFYECSSLETLPAGFTVPDSVTGMFGTFYGCTSLSGTITINATSAGIDDYYEFCFNDAGKDSSGITVICNDSELTTKLQSTVGAGNVIFTTSTP